MSTDVDTATALAYSERRYSNRLVSALGAAAEHLLRDATMHEAQAEDPTMRGVAVLEDYCHTVARAGRRSERMPVPLATPATPAVPAAPEEADGGYRLTL